MFVPGYEFFCLSRDEHEIQIMYQIIKFESDYLDFKIDKIVIRVIRDKVYHSEIESSRRKHFGLLAIMITTF